MLTAELIRFRRTPCRVRTRTGGAAYDIVVAVN
jgi:hypothetical protein